MRLKKLNRSDAPKVLQLEEHSAPREPHYSPYDEEALNFLFDKPTNCGAVGLFDRTKLIGWGADRTNWKKHDRERGTSEVSSVVIDKKYRRRGLGSKILNEIMRILVEDHDTSQFFLTVSPLNTGALMLYLKSGFLIYDFRKDVYGPGADRVYLMFDGEKKK